MVVFDASSFVSAAMRADGIPERALLHAFRFDQVAISDAVLAEYLKVIHRPRLAKFLNIEVRAFVLRQLQSLGIRFVPAEPITDCRDPKDNKYLELALAAKAEAIVSSDNDLLVLHPWRGVPVVSPASYLARSVSPPVA